MTKKELIWREILVQKRQNNQIKFTQKELAEKFSFSVSTVFNALKSLREAHVVEVMGRFFVLNDYRKLLYLWASERNPAADFISKFFVDKPVSELEAITPPEATPALYSGYKFLYGSAPADYDHLYVYLKKDDLDKFSKRFTESAMPFKKTRARPNIFVIEKDAQFDRYQQPLPEEIFVDTWNAPEWYAKDFLATLEDKLF